MINISKFLDFRYFLISLAFGLALVYLWAPSPTVIYVYPNKDNIDKLQVKDAAGNCFKFKTKKVKCPSDPNKITKTPIQTGNQD